MSSGAGYTFHLCAATGLTPDEVRYRLPYAQGLQLIALRLYGMGNKYLQAPLPQGERFADIAGLN